MSGEQKNWQGIWALAACLIFVPLVGIGGLIFLVGENSSGLWPRDMNPWDADPNPTTETLAAIDSSLRLLEAARKERENVVFSPLLVNESLEIIYKASRGKTAAQIDRLLVDPAKFEGLEGSHVYSRGILLESLVPGVDWIEKDSSIFGRERTLFLSPGSELKLDEWFRWSDATARAFDRGDTWQGVDGAWRERSFTAQTRAGVTRLSMANDGGRLMDLETTLYSSSRWSWSGSHRSSVSEGLGLAPFHVNGTTLMVPTVCTLNWEWSGVLVNQDRTPFVVRWNVWSSFGQQFWIVTNNQPSSDESRYPLFSVEDMEQWLYNEEFRPSGEMPGSKTSGWLPVKHIHFPRFTVTSEIDLKKICQVLGADQAFDPKLSDTVKFAGEKAYVDQFHTALTISVDGSGIGGGPVSTVPVTAVLNCKTPELVVDRPFIFMQMDYHELLLIGHVETPTDR